MHVFQFSLVSLKHELFVLTTHFLTFKITIFLKLYYSFMMIGTEKKLIFQKKLRNSVAKP